MFGSNFVDFFTLRTFALIVSAHPYCALKFTCHATPCHAMHRARALSTNRELKQTATATATGTLLNKRFNEQNNSCARAL